MARRSESAGKTRSCLAARLVREEGHMTPRTTPPFRADHVGSFLRPKYLLDAREQFRGGVIGAEALRKIEDEAIREIARYQESLGLRGITDGEFRRTFFHVDFLTQLDGVETHGGIHVRFHSAK